MEFSPFARRIRPALRVRLSKIPRLRPQFAFFFSGMRGFAFLPVSFAVLLATCSVCPKLLSHFEMVLRLSGAFVLFFYVGLSLWLLFFALFLCFVLFLLCFFAPLFRSFCFFDLHCLRETVSFAVYLHFLALISYEIHRPWLQPQIEPAQTVGSQNFNQIAHPTPSTSTSPAFLHHQRASAAPSHPHRTRGKKLRKHGLCDIFRRVGALC